jgi:cellulose synthase (UDP-forming)
LIYSRADTWLSWRDDRDVDRPLSSLLLIGMIACRGLLLAARGLFSTGQNGHDAAPAKPDLPSKAASVFTGTLPLWILAAMLLLSSGRSPAQDKAAETKGPDANAATLRHTLAAGEFEESYDLAALGHPKPVVLRGADGVFRLNFGIPVTKVVSDATLLLRYRAAPELVSGKSVIALVLNGVDVGTISIEQASSGVSEARVTLPADLLGSDNQLTFNLEGTLSQGTGNSDSSILTQIERSTQIQLTGKILPLANDLALLPAPFFDRSNSRPVVLPVVFMAPPSPQMIAASGIVASYFGTLADYRGAHFPVSIGNFPLGNTLCFVDRSSGSPAELEVGNLHGPGIAMRNNPGDRGGKILIVMGDNPDEVITAARALSLMQFVRAGDSSTVTDFHMPAPAAADSAPRWLRINRISPLAAFESAEQLQVFGSGSVEVYFRVPPDLRFGAQETVPLQLKYRYRGVASGHRGSITVRLNGTFVATIELLPEGQNETDVLTRTLPINVSALSKFGNTLTFDFSFGHENQNGNPASAANQYGAILKESTLDLRGVPGFVEMPNLSLFGEAGFPFTRYPDLSHTAVVLPSEPTPEQIALSLAMLASMGARTGAAGTRVTVVDARHVEQVRDRDLLVLGSGRDQPLFQKWPLPLQIQRDGFQLAEIHNPLERAKVWWHGGYGAGRQQLADLLSSTTPPESGVLQIESPEQRGLTAILLVSLNPGEADGLSSIMTPATSNNGISGNICLLAGDDVHCSDWSYRSYFVGQQSLYGWTNFWLVRFFVLVPIFVCLVALLLAGWLHGWLQRRAVCRLEGQPS